MRSLCWLVLLVACAAPASPEAPSESSTSGAEPNATPTSDEDANDTSPNDTSANDTSANDTSPNDTSANDTSANDTNDAPTDWLDGCEPEALTPPTLPDPDRRRPAKIALLLPSTAPLDVPEVRARLAEALIARLRRLGHRNVLPWSETLAAEALRDSRRVSDETAQCAGEPALVTVLRARHPNLETASLARFHQCDASTDGGEPVCGHRLLLTFDRVAPPAPPLPLDAILEGTDADAWLAAIPRLRRMSIGMSGIVGLGLDTRFRVVDLADEDPWLRVDDVLRERRAAILACDPSTSRHDVALEVRPDGSVAEVRFFGASAESHACLNAALRDARFPCTLDGQPRTPRVAICTRALPR
jgi:hypothetical protein